MDKKTEAKKVFSSGRKSKPKPKRTSLVSLRLTEEEKEAWEAKALAAGMGNNISKFIRYCVEHDRIYIAPPVPAINEHIYIELGRIGNNINQIAYAINRAVKLGEAIAIAADPRSEIEALKPLLLEVKQMLLGLPNQPDQIFPSLREESD
ncbi:MobC family plasmid mobilization relaxosome protein [Plectonema radiosum NIES-515]|uniref:MobC family plasmid mobilization relaxosome protein n=1 Tax=Plectonema radiosum NIES-515 TaxID=2986073 RepID=A0ABT3AZ93_9CYAN|nr:MobC family plasmid mobilization relaxosome protein [Plectonema radiosum]MCV3214050.1 MobC family plasmid mobilization relaxosome protein [Plectonema radiosum NIES-515]